MERIEYEVMAAVERTHWWYGSMRALTAAILDPLYGLRDDLFILDAGCGTGGNALFLQRYGRVVGVDSASEAIALNHAPDRLVCGSVHPLPFADETFDLVTSFEVLYHRGVEDEVAALREAHRVLRPGGRVLLRLPAYEFLRCRHDRQVHTRRRYTAPEVRRLLREAGFFVERCSYVNSLLFPIPLALRLLERVVHPTEKQSSEMAPPHPLVNSLLRWPMAVEAAWLSFGGSFPFGVTILCLAHCGKIEQVSTRLV